MSYAGSPAHLQLCQQNDLYPPFSESSDILADSAVGEPRTALYPTLSSQLHPRRIFARQNSEGTIRPLNPHLFTAHHHPQIYQSFHSFTNVPPQQHWPRNSQPWPLQYSAPSSVKQPDGHLHYPPLSSRSPLPHPQLSPSAHHQGKRTSSGGGLSSPGNRLAFTETVDPSTGLLLRTPEHPRLRTAQACQKCRLRKAKCSGEHPTCERCVTRGLVCEYAKEGRVRGPNKPKGKSSGNSGGNEASTGTDNATSAHNGRPGTRTRTSSASSSSRSFTPTYCSTLSTDGDGFFLPSDVAPGLGGHTGVENQYPHDNYGSGNSFLMQENFGGPPSVTIRRLHRESATFHLPTDQRLSFEMRQSELIPIGLNEAAGISSHSIKSQDMIFQAVPCHQRQDDVCGSFSGSRGSPATVSSIGSPLTPDSAPTSMSLLPNILRDISHLPSQENKFSSPNFHFGLEPVLGPPSSSHSYSHIRTERGTSYGYHSPMDISICSP